MADTSFPSTQRASEGLQQYLRELKTALEAKDPRAGRVPPASVLLSFPGDGMITIDVGANRVRVIEGDVRDREAPSLLVRTSLRTWLSVCAGERGLDEVEADVLGDPALLAALAKLFAQKRSSVAARFF